LSNPVVRALEQMAERVGRALSKDAGRAIEEMYRDAGKRTEAVIARVKAADEEQAQKLLRIAEQMGRNASRGVTSDAQRAAQVKANTALRRRIKDILEPKDPYRRPTGFRGGVRDKVFDLNKQDDGIVRDPLTGQQINSDEPWDMGHKPGFEFRKHRESAQTRAIPRSQFLDEHNDPTHYRPELPASNQEHAGEDHTDLYLGP